MGQSKVDHCHQSSAKKWDTVHLQVSLRFHLARMVKDLPIKAIEPYLTLAKVHKGSQFIESKFFSS